MLVGRADIGVRAVIHRPGVAGGRRHLEVRHRRQAVAFANTADDIAEAVDDRGVEFGLDDAAVEREGEAFGRLERQLGFQAHRVRLRRVEDDARRA